MAFWLVSQTVLVVALVLMLHNLTSRVGAVYRFLFYIPGALAGAASVIVWLFMLDPSASPFAFVLHWFGYAQFNNTIAPGNLPVIFAIMAFWTGAGGWIVVMYGALNNIPHELIESAEIDGVERIPNRAADQAPADQEVGRLHGRPGLRRGDAAVRRARGAGHGVVGRRDQQVLVAESARLVCRVPVQLLQPSRRDLRRPARVRPRRRGSSSSGAEGCSRSSDGDSSTLRASASSLSPSCCSSRRSSSCRWSGCSSRRPRRMANC